MRHVAFLVLLLSSCTTSTPECPPCPCEDKAKEEPTEEKEAEAPAEEDADKTDEEPSTKE